MNDRYSNFVVACLYRTAVAVSALILSASVAYAADPPVPRGNVSVTVNPTTGYYSSTNSTLRLPNGVSASSSAGGLPVVSKYSGGLQQTIPMGITIDAIKQTAPLPVVVRSTTQKVKSAAGRCLKSGRCNVALLLAGEGLNRLFDGLDWVMDEGGKIQKLGNEIPDGIPQSYVTQTRPSNVETLGENDFAIHTFENGVSSVCRYIHQGFNLTSVYRHPTKHPSSSVCYYGDSIPDPATPIPVSESQIDYQVENNYIPDPSDWQALTPELELSDVEITSAPTLKGEPITTTVYDADGNPLEITETNIWYDFDIRDNPSSSPSLDMKTRKETKTYKDGALTGTTTTETTQPGTGGGSKVEIPTVEIPTDCDFHPTLCKWLDWTKEEPTEPDLDLKPLLQTTNIEMKSFVFSASDAGCPAPIALDLSFLGSREVSYQPLCDLASTMKPLYLALMAFLSALLISRSINRV